MDINADQAKGKIKEAVGDLTDDDKLKSEGQVDQLLGDAKATVGFAGQDGPGHMLARRGGCCGWGVVRQCMIAVL